EAERQIRELLSRYGHLADACADDEFIELWFDDGVIEVSMGGDGAYRDQLRFEGRQAITEFIADPQGHHRTGFYRRSVHVQCNPLITVDRDTAVGRARIRSCCRASTALTKSLVPGPASGDSAATTEPGRLR